MDLFAQLAAVLRPHREELEAARAAASEVRRLLEHDDVLEEVRARSRRAIEESRLAIERSNASLAKVQ